jgi:hypothetical protein
VDYYEVLASKATPVEPEPGETSYFSEPQAGLDPRLFRNEHIIGHVRQAILGVLFTYLKQDYSDPESWATVWLAGSGVSRQWAAHRNPADLDCLIGIDYIAFRQANPQYRGFSDQDIASTFNEGFGSVLNKETDNFMDTYELTFYVNVRSNIADIKPYAAYNLTTDDWTITPATQLPAHMKEWDNKTSRDYSMGVQIINRYQKALNDISAAQNTAARINAESALKLAISQGAALFEEIHQGRKAAFSPSGAGYLDYANYRWQSGKESGIVPALKKIKEISNETEKEFNVRTYGVELPDASVLVRRAITRK